MSFSICHHGAAINKNHDGKILPTLFFMLMKTKCKRKTESHNERLNTQLYRIKCYSSCFFFSFLPQNCSGFTIEILIIVIKCFLIFVPFLILSLFHNDVYVMLYSFIHAVLKWNALSSYFYSKNSFSKNIHYVTHLIFKNGINNIFSSQTSFLLLSSDMHASFTNKPIKFTLVSLIHDGIFLPS